MAATKLKIKLDSTGRPTDDSKLKLYHPIDHSKKLVVLDFNFSIVYFSDENDDAKMRNSLVPFLSKIGKSYNIIIWSTESRTETLRVLRQLKLLDNPRFKVSAVLGRENCVLLRTRKGPKLVKPLKTIWTQLPQFSTDSTVYISPFQSSSICNPRELVKVKQYRGHFDNQLKPLGHYLNQLARKPTLKSTKHKVWHKI